MMVRYSPTEVALLSTLAYTDQFAFPLTEQEIWLRLVVLPRRPVSLRAFRATLKTLLKKKKIQRSGEYYFLPGRRTLPQIRAYRQRIAHQKWKHVQLFLQRVSWLPTIQAIFVTGSLAMENVEKESDYDFMIVTLPQTLWLTRFIVTCIAWVSGKRRSWHGEEKNNWCLNLWLDTDHLVIPPKRRNMYTAYEVIQAKPIFARQQTDLLFFVENNWIRKYLPNAVGIARQHISVPIQVSFLALLQNVLGLLLSPFDWVAWKLQLWYMQPHRTSEKVGRAYAFFHPRDTRAIITENWRTSLQKVGL